MEFVFASAVWCPRFGCCGQASTVEVMVDLEKDMEESQHRSQCMNPGACQDVAQEGDRTTMVPCNAAVLLQAQDGVSRFSDKSERKPLPYIAIHCD